MAAFKAWEIASSSPTDRKFQGIEFSLIHFSMSTLIYICWKMLIFEGRAYSTSLSLTVWVYSAIQLITMATVLLVGINCNDVYITLEKGEYEKRSKTAQKNVEVAVVFVNDSGEIRQVSCVCLCIEI